MEAPEAVIVTLTTTLMVEGTLAAAYARRRRKPVCRLLAACLLANLLTQAVLWVMLWILPAQYLTVLFAMEVLIWLSEAGLYAAFPGLVWTGAEPLLFSLGLNAASFAAGWLLPV